jgi:Holliday junction DNA helicase RuvB
MQNIDISVTRSALDSLGIDKAGLNETDRRVLKAIIDSYAGGPVGIDSLAATLNEEPGTVIDMVEPYLLKAGFLKRTSRGRLATELAFKHFGITYNKEKQKELF